MLRLVSFPRNSHVLRHLLSIKFADEGTAVTITLAYAKAVAWSRHATGERVQRGRECNGGMTLQEAWHQCSFFLPTIIQTKHVSLSLFWINWKVSLLSINRYFHWNLLKVKALSFYKNTNISYLEAYFNPPMEKKIFCMRTMPTFTSVKGGQNKSLSHEISFINNNNKYL